MNRAYGYRIYRLYFDNENRFDITLRRRIWHLPTCNQGQVIIIFGKAAQRPGQKEGLSLEVGGPTDPAPGLTAYSHSRSLSFEIPLERLMRDDGGSRAHVFLFHLERCDGTTIYAPLAVIHPADTSVEVP